MQDTAQHDSALDRRVETRGQEPTWVQQARDIATEAHTGQVDKRGVAYIQHPQAVAKVFEEKGEWVRAAAAWLHDVVEDTELTAQDLLERGEPVEVVGIVDLLTRKEEVPDDEYYALIAEHPDALAVKLSDMRHNTDPERQKDLDKPTVIRLLNKYIHAAEALGQPDFASELRERLLGIG